jgi:3-phenylpropionate/trans-cinnamate dioxygenase ferredoxin subunit
MSVSTTVDGFVWASRLADIPDGGMRPATTADGRRLCLVRRGDEVWALADACTHQAFPLSAGEADGAKCEITCVWHGARFDCATGAVLQGPATDPVPVFAVRVDDGQVYVGPRSA